MDGDFGVSQLSRPPPRQWHTRFCLSPAHQRVQCSLPVIEIMWILQELLLASEDCRQESFPLEIYAKVSVSYPRTRQSQTKQTSSSPTSVEVCELERRSIDNQQSSPYISGPLTNIFSPLDFGGHNGESTVAQLSVN